MKIPKFARCGSKNRGYGDRSAFLTRDYSDLGDHEQVSGRIRHFTMQILVLHVLLLITVFFPDSQSDRSCLSEDRLVLVDAFSRNSMTNEREVGFRR